MRTPDRNRSPGPKRAFMQGVLGIALGLLLAAPASATHYDFAARDATVTALLEAGQRLDHGRASQRALDLIREVQAEAVSAYRGGDTEAGYERLDQAYVLVQTVVRQLAADPAVGRSLVVPTRIDTPEVDARQARYDTLMHSVMALQAAYHSIRDEVGAPAASVSGQVATWVAAAEAEREAGRLDIGLRKLKVAYTTLQSEIIRLRGGQTLVRELSFASAAEEYAYEVDRHDSHLLLVELLLGKAQDNPVREAEIETAVDESMRMHWIAHKYAAAGDYQQAVAWLELASDGLASLIRKQGFDIPRQ